jgi:replicative DNA helicase
MDSPDLGRFPASSKDNGLILMDTPSIPNVQVDSDRKHPYSAEAEVAVLGGMLIDQDALTKAIEIVDESMFYREGNRRLFRAMVRIFGQGDVVDPITLKTELESTDGLEVVGGASYLSDLLDAVPTAANITYHAQIVKNKAILRRLIDAASGIIRDVQDQGERTVDEVLDQAEQSVFQVAENHDRSGFVRVKEILHRTMENIEEMQDASGGITGAPSGFSELDLMTTGFQKGDLVIVAARPAMGKTSWILNVAQSLAIRHEIPVAIFSLEMSKEQLVQRFLCGEGRVDNQKLRQGRMNEDEWKKLAVAAGRLNTAPLWIDDSPGSTVLEMRAKARRLKTETNLGMIVVDYMQLMSGTQRRSENRVQEVSEISRGLKSLARELEVPVVALSQLSRAPEQRPDRRPQLSDLRDSGSIEQDADIVMFLYRPEYYFGPVDKDGNSLEGKAELIISKQRNGPTGTVNLVFHKSYTRFDSLARGQDGAIGPGI